MYPNGYDRFGGGGGRVDESINIICHLDYKDFKTVFKQRDQPSVAGKNTYCRAVVSRTDDDDDDDGRPRRMVTRSSRTTRRRTFSLSLSLSL